MTSSLSEVAPVSASQREEVFTRFNGQPPFASAGAKNADGLEILYWVATMSVPFPVVMTT
ncbi:hypothetical protein [Deinococcus enclensis]|jgi:hypothetical protein|uniref:Uncharacterized protein n=1 Tax=Deinococcus enclensis TaxID=1049582 RepID=A0ABT9MC59_9DEIO|nr:hypothetical protein [Deinococcus enclensis]MDP9764168.1 hypothetical protein [Deinococcus enclensis]